MPGLEHLPPELFYPVLDLALKDTADIQHLCNLSLLSRQWYVTLVPRIYSEWTYNGARQSFMSLWNFLRTILSNAPRAALVQTLNIGNWGYYPHTCPRGRREVNLLHEDLVLIRDAIQKAGIKHLESNIIKDLRKRDRRPLMALLLTCLPNLTRIYAHVPKSDPVLNAVLRQVLDCQCSSNPSPVLGKLRELHIFGEVDVPISGVLDYDQLPKADDTPLHLDELWPVLHLSNLETLSLYGLDTANAALRLGISPAISRLKHLSLISGFYSNCTYMDVQTILSLPEALTSFTLYIHDYMFGSRTGNTISNAGLWEVLKQHQHSLEYLDVYRNAGSTRHTTRRDRFGPLSSFTRLKKLCVQIEVLLDSGYYMSIAPFSLKDTLPYSLETLTLHNDDRVTCVGDLAAQLQEVLGNGEFPSLKLIELEGKRWSEDIHSAITDVCHQHDVSFSLRKRRQHKDIPEECQFRKGGRCPQFLPKTYHIRMDGQRRAVMFAFYPKESRSREELLLPFDDRMDACEDVNLDDEDLQRGCDWTIHVLGIHAYGGHPGAAYMVFRNYEGCSLPPLFSFAIYFTHADVSPAKVDHEALYWALCSSYGNYDARFDLYFIPGLSEDGCISHYRAEKRFRGDYKQQLRKYKESSRYDTPSRLGVQPGIVHDYSDTGPYKGLLFICPESGWGDDQETLRSVQFDPIRRTGDVPESSERPRVCIQQHPINDDSPWYEAYNGECPVDRWMSDIARWHREELMGPWLKATRRGWKTWR
ncbi:hypothetical protein BDV28DRAFT_160858 [Aspergillus coremiiformis]|uniref:Leucine-rich repeat domain-containing protein n=1 Tax=Aspergillus coremiiformis TaxID=138285 RepID=A0A5N6YU82_9EURO|nr:hypothetical protein BDV28DRAFT_160858 [Aspergillus coremiiformis]